MRFQLLAVQSWLGAGSLAMLHLQERQRIRFLLDSFHRCRWIHSLRLSTPGRGHLPEELAEQAKEELNRR